MENKTMELLEPNIEKKAMNGEPIPKELDVVDACMYLGLKYLYSMYRVGLISREKAAEEKRRLYLSSVEYRSKIDFIDREFMKLKNRISEAAERYMDEPTIENAEKMYAAFYNISDDWRKGENERKKDA